MNDEFSFVVRPVISPNGENYIHSKLRLQKILYATAVAAAAAAVAAFRTMYGQIGQVKIISARLGECATSRCVISSVSCLWCNGLH